MADKKLSGAQVVQLGDALVDTGKNVYREAERLFGVKVGDEVFDQLAEGRDGIFKCERCNFWRGLSQRDWDAPDYCHSCVEEFGSGGE